MLKHLLRFRFVDAFTVFTVFTIACVMPAAGAAAASRSAEPGPVTEWLVAPAGADDRDQLLPQLIDGRWTPPEAGAPLDGDAAASPRWEAVALDDGETRLASDKLDGGYAYVRITVDEPTVRVIEIAGPEMLYVNGVPRLGDRYEHGLVRLPVMLEEGENDLLAWVRRGAVELTIEEPPANAFFLPADTTTPDLLVDEAFDLPAAIVVANATEAPMRELVIRVEGEGFETTTTPVPEIGPLSVRKVGFDLRGPAPEEAGAELELSLSLTRSEDAAEVDEASLDETPLTLNVRRPTEIHRRTFISRMDNSVQYYAARQARVVRTDGDQRAGLVLLLHGAAVEADRQLRFIPSRRWHHTVAATNRRPYGFGWEWWGRLDALEVLELGAARFEHDPARVYLTGHSMGGWGTWHVASLHADRFAAIGPAASYNWWSRFSGRRPSEASPIDSMLYRLTYANDSIALRDNYKQMGIYILHHGADDVVRPQQAELMSRELSTFHEDWRFHLEGREPRGWAHNWDLKYSDSGPAKASHDWPAMYDFFARHARPRSDMLRRVEFTTPNPAVTSEWHWMTIEAQRRAHLPSSVDVLRWVNRRRFEGTTRNVARLAIDVSDLEPAAPDSPETIEVTLDGQTFEDLAFPEDMTLRFARDAEGEWAPTEPAPLAEKGPHRYGPFRTSLRNNVVLVHGTAGTSEENAWARRRARLDAERLWYRGNSGAEVIADTDFDPASEPNRDVLLYGHAGMNTAWDALLEDSPVTVRDQVVTVGERTLEGDDLACLFVRPRPRSDTASVAVVAATGEKGRRLSYEQNFVSRPHARFPDLFVARPGGDRRAYAQPEVAGFFGLDWSLETGEIVWR